jgi:hypothetical protein
VVGTSNSAAFSISSLPFTFTSSFDVVITFNNNGTQGVGHVNCAGTGMTFYNSPTSTTWSTTGSKSSTGSFIAQIN